MTTLLTEDASSSSSSVVAAEVASSTSQIPFINDLALLPANGPTNHAHIINLSPEYDSESNKQGINLQDALATTLFKVSPTTLEFFLNPKTHTFKAIFGKRDTQLVIWRKGLEVFVSFCCKYFNIHTFLCFVFLCSTRVSPFSFFPPLFFNTNNYLSPPFF